MAKLWKVPVYRDVEANTAEEAHAIVRDAIGQKAEFGCYWIGEVEEVQPVLNGWEEEDKQWPNEAR